MSKNNSVQRPKNSRIYPSDPPAAEMRLIEEVKRLSKENESLRMMGSPVVEATIQHQVMEIMKLKQQVAELRSVIEQMEKQEPVAYWSEMYQCYSFDQKYCDSVPLYTREDLK